MVESQPPGMEKKIIIAMDGSEDSDMAFNWYMKHLHRSNHYIIFLHCPERHSFITGPLGGTADVEAIQQLMTTEDEKERAFLENLGQKLKDAGIGGKVKSVAGKAGEVIVGVAREEDASYIVVGSRGHSKIRRTFMGSVSDYVLHHSHIPVFVCRHKDFHHHHGHGKHHKHEKPAH